MEVVGAVASVFSVVGFAGQLNQGIGKLYAFWSNIKDSPVSIQNIACGLDTLTELLSEIASEGQNVAPNDLLAKLLLQAQSTVQELTAVVQDLEPGFNSKKSILRKWSALKSVLKSEKLLKYQETLASLERKLMLVLETQQSYHLDADYTSKYSRLGRVRFQRLEQKLITINENTKARELTYTTGTAQICPGPASDFESSQKNIRANTSSPKHNFIANNDFSMSTGSRVLSRTILWTKRLCLESTSSLSSRLGSVQIHSQRISWQLVNIGSEATHGEQDQYEDRTSCIFLPASWLRSLGFRRALHVGLTQPSMGPWKPTMNIYNTVSEDAQIFELCARGDVLGVRDLLLLGKASVHDMDPVGRTLIYFAVNNTQPRMYHFLINAGAQETLLVPKTRRQDRIDHPLQTMMFRWRQGNINLNDTMNAIRTFQRHVDFEVEASGWKLLMIWAFAYDSRFDKKGAAEIDLLGWFLQLFMSDIVANVNSRPCKMLLLQLLDWPAALDCFFEKIPTHNVDEAGPPQEYTILQQAIAAGCDYSAVLKHHPDLHAVRFDNGMSRKLETPTSLAMYNAREFEVWRKSLEHMNEDLEEFLDDELRQAPLKNDGWTKDTLRELFQFQIDPSLKKPPPGYYEFCPIQYCVGKCGSTHWWFAGIKVQPFWMLILEFIKSGVSAKQLQEHGVPIGVGLPGDGNSNNDTEQLTMVSHPDAIMPLRDNRLAKWIRNDLKYSEVEARKSAYGYEKRNVFCMECWLFYEKTGKFLGAERHRWEKEAEKVEAEFSPFFIHSSSDGPIKASTTRRYTRPISQFGDTDMEQAIERILSGRRGATGALINYY